MFYEDLDRDELPELNHPPVLRVDLSWHPQLVTEVCTRVETVIATFYTSPCTVLACNWNMELPLAMTLLVATS